MMLDASGYLPSHDLSTVRLVEPSSGSGSFVLPALARLSASLKARGKTLADARGSFAAFELQQKNVQVLKSAMLEILLREGWSLEEAVNFIDDAVKHCDYLMADHEVGSVDLLIGNPPYVRIEDLGSERLAAYKAVSPSMKGRADIFVGFFDVGLDTLSEGGKCVFICADRWLRNSYGKALRRKIIDHYAIDLVFTMHNVDAFEEKVSAYPAITVIRRGDQGQVCLADGKVGFDEAAVSPFLSWYSKRNGKQLSQEHLSADWLPHWFNTDESWPDAPPARIQWLDSLAERFPLIEESGVRIGIGVATGKDSIFVVRGEAIPDVERERLLPLLVGKDIASGTFLSTETYLVNPWSRDGLVELDEWPKLKKYFDEHKAELEKRHTAKGSVDKWYRTIDRVNYELIDRPKLLMRDIQDTSQPVYHPGGKYPHHNLYWLTSDAWDLKVLGGLMLSEVVEAQVGAYCVKMRGETLRFQAQYLKRVRVPQFADIPPSERTALVNAFEARDREAATQAALRAYGMTHLPG